MSQGPITLIVRELIVDKRGYLYAKVFHGASS
jgi:hypothetical protein